MDFLGFALAVLLVELTPGPNMAWLAGLATVEGRRIGFAAVAGVAIGLLLNGALAALGLTAVLAAAPALSRALRLAGAGMMFLLAIQAWRGADMPAAGAASQASLRRAFLTGAAINLLNPKAYLFFIVVAPEFLRGQSLTVTSALSLTIISTLIATTIHIGIVLAGAGAHRWFGDPMRTRLVRRLLALIMAGVGASFLFADLR